MKKRTLAAIVLLIVLICCLSTGCTKEVTDKSMKVNYLGTDYSGSYTGTCENNIPQGEGEFNFKKDDQYLKYKGTFKDGAFSEKGNLETNFYKITIGKLERVGEYKGDVVDGIPNGNGTFTTKNDENVEYTYKGEWKDGIYNGQGTTAWDSDEVWVQIGTYNKGKFEPDFPELIATLATYPKMPFTLSDKTTDFLKQHKDLFVTNNLEALKPYLDTTVQYKHLQKSSGKYDGKIILFNGTVQQVFENVSDDDTNKYSYTDLLIADDNYDYYWVFYPGTCEFYEGDNITVYGLPLGSSSFDNVSGGTTIVQVLAANALLPR